MSGRSPVCHTGVLKSKPEEGYIQTPRILADIRLNPLVNIQTNSNDDGVLGQTLVFFVSPGIQQFA